MRKIPRTVPDDAVKGVEFLLRLAGQAPEQRSARKLVARLGDEGVAAGPRVLVVSPRDWSSVVQYDAMMAQGLRQRGAQVSFLSCGGGLEICDRANTHESPPPTCTTCSRYNSVAIEAHGFERKQMADYWGDVDDEWPELDDLAATDLIGVEVDDLPLGELVDIPVKWFLCAANISDDPLAAPTNRAFLRAARKVATAVGRVLDEVQPEHVLMLNGLFMFEAVTWALCRQRGIDVVTYERAFRQETLVFNREVPAGYYDFRVAWAENGRPLRTDEEAELDAYLEQRRTGSAFDQHWKWRETDLSGGEGRLAVMFTNLTWDTAVIKRDDAFDSIESWATRTVEYFIDHPEHRLIVRVHPAEVGLPGKRTRDSLFAYLSARFPELPDNIRIIAPDDPTGSYPLMEACDVGLVYTSTTGMELALAGKPVITAGQTHYKDKGFTEDPHSPEEFVAALDRVLEDPGSLPSDRDLARRYAHFFFFRAPVPSPGVVEPIKGLARLSIDDPQDLRPGGNAALDRICDAILDRSSFIPVG